MTFPLTLVTGATGRIGRPLVFELLASGVPVRALVHRRDERSDALAALGAEVVVGDLFDAVAVDQATRGVTRVAFIGPWHPQLPQAAAALATAMIKHEVEALVSLTQWLASPTHPALSTRHADLVERLFDALPGTARVRVEPGFFADSYLAMTPLAAQLGVLPTPGHGRNAPPSNEDVARVMAAAIREPALHNGQRYRPTGPELLTLPEMADLIGQAVGRRVRHVEVPLWMFLRAANLQGKRVGIDRYLLAQVRHFMAEQDLGTWEYKAPTTVVRDVTGAEAEDFLTIAKRYAARPEAQRTTRNFVRELRDFMLVPVVPTPWLTRFERAQQHPQPSITELSGASVAWRAERAATAGALEVSA